MVGAPHVAILGQLDPLARDLSAWGWDLATAAIGYRYEVGEVLTALIAAFVVFPRARSQQRIPWLVVALLAGVWGQILLFSDVVIPGTALFGLAVLAAVPFGAANPIPSASAPARLWPELALVAGLTALALVVRLHAIDQMPGFVDIEPVLAFFESLSPSGLAHYVAFNRVNDDGFVHMLARAAVLHVAGPSIVGIRLTGVLLGTAAVPLCYALVRRLTGIVPAALATLLLLTAQEQLIFSRIEANQFVPVVSAAFVTVLLVLWLTRTWSTGAAVATAAWLPLTRFFYAPAIVLVLLPFGTVLHAVAWGSMRRRARIVLPILVVGFALWLCSSPLLRYTATGDWGEATSLRLYGNSVFTPFNTEGDAEPVGTVSLLRFQLDRFLVNTGQMMKQLAYDRHAYDAWYIRVHPDEEHKRMMHAATLVAFATGLGFLLGRWRDPRAATLLLWVFLGTLPGVLSDIPEPRRLMVFFAAVPVVVGVFVDAIVRAVRADAPRLAGWPLHVALTAAAGLIAFTSVAVHYQIYRAPLTYTEYIACTRPYFESSDVIFHNIADVNTISILAFGNAVPFRRRLPGLHLVRDWNAEWDQMTNPRLSTCPFDDAVFGAVAPPAAVQARCADFHPRRITYLLHAETEAEQSVARRLLAAYPEATIDDCRGHDQDDAIERLLAFTVEAP